MPKTRKTLQLKNLAKYDVYIEDRVATSQYFQITNLPQLFTGGRNSFLIGGSDFLRPYTNILIEILDAKGAPIFQNPVQTYLEGNKRLVSVEINEDTAVGLATIIIIGVASKTINGDDIPLNWQDKYNVRWVQQVLIEPNLRNTSPLKFLNEPIIYAEEKRFFNVATSSFSTVTQSFTASLTPILYSSFQKGYLITATAPTTFSSDHYGAIITGSLFIGQLTASVNLPITNILNSTTAFSEGYLIQTNDGKTLDKIYLTSGSYQTTAYNTLSNITSSVILYYNTLQTINTNIPISYAKLRVANINTVSGETFKSKIYSKVTTNTSDYKLIGDVNIKTEELLVTSSIRGEFPIGDMSISPTASDNWYSDRLETSSNVIYNISGSIAYYNPTSTVTPFTLEVSDDVLLRSIKSQVPIYNNQQYNGYLSSSGYFIGNKQPVLLFPTTEYTLEFDAYYKKSSGSVNLIGQTPRLDIYIIGVSGSNIIDKNPLGQKIGELEVVSNAEVQWYQNKQFNFFPLLSAQGSVGIRFVITNGFWWFSNISLKPASDVRFSPDEAQFLIPNTEYFNDYLQYKVEFFDINNNSTDIAAISLPTFFTGSNIDLGTLP